MKPRVNVDDVELLDGTHDAAVVHRSACPSAQRAVSPFGWLMLKIDVPMDTGALTPRRVHRARGGGVPFSSSSVRVDVVVRHHELGAAGHLLCARIAATLRRSSSVARRTRRW